MCVAKGRTKAEERETRERKRRQCLTAISVRSICNVTQRSNQLVVSFSGILDSLFGRFGFVFVLPFS